MMKQEKDVIELLNKYNQNHIIEHMCKIEEQEKDNLIEQIKEIDFEEITKLYNKTITEREKKNIKIEPLQTVIVDKILEQQKSEYIKEGEKILKENKYAVVTMAGGQGTRLRT